MAINLPQYTGSAGGSGSSLSSMGGIGQLMQGAGAGVNFGSALGTLIGGGKNTKKAVKHVLAAGRADAAAAMLAAEQQASQHVQNAYLANFDASIVGSMARDEAELTRRQGRALAGQQVAAAAAQGASIQDASVLDIIRDQMVDIEVQATQQIYAGELQKKSLRQQSQDYLESARAVRAEGRDRMNAILQQASLDAYKLKLQRQQQVVGAIGSIIQGVGAGYSLFSGLRSIGQTAPGQGMAYSQQYDAPIGPPAPVETAPLIEPQEYLDYARR